MLVVDDRDDPAATQSSLGSLSEEYARYVAQRHAGCPDCPVGRSGCLTADAMFEWKATAADGCLDRWTRGDVRAFLAEHLPRAASDDPRRAMDAATCIRDVVYFLTDRGTYRGEGVEPLVATALGAIDDFVGERGGVPAPGDEFTLIERRLDLAARGDDHERVVELVERALTLPEAAPELAELLDTLAWALEELGRFDDAVDAMRRAAAAGLDKPFDDHPSTAALIAHLLLRAGRVDEAHVAWCEAEAERPGDAWIHEAAGCAYAAAGLHDLALDWRTRGLRLALERGEGDLIELLLEDRDLHDALAAEAAAFIDDHDWSWEFNEPPRRQTAVRVRGSVLAWFPPAEHARALKLWPRFAGEPANVEYDSYCARLERALQHLRQHGTQRPAIAPVNVEQYCAWCQSRGCDPELPDSRLVYAEELEGRGVAGAWPPGRNDSCWCSSGRKYKKCCLRAA